jgi:co-chaperonin GroES (HSP10)
MSRTIAAAPPPPATRILADKVEDVRMMGDRILLRPLDWNPSKVIHVERRGRPLRGEVMAVGKGHNPMKYKHVHGKKLMNYSRHFRPTEVKPGDIVELGGLNQFDGKGYQFPEVVVGSETMLIISERDVAAVHVNASDCG